MANQLRQRLSPSEQRQLQLQLEMFWHGRPLRERNAYANILVFLILRGGDAIAPAAFEVIVYDIIRDPGMRLPWSMDHAEDFRDTVAAAVVAKLRAEGIPRGHVRPRPWRKLAAYQRKQHDLCNSNFQAWLRKVAKTTAIDILRGHPMSMGAKEEHRWRDHVPLDDFDEGSLAMEHWRAQTPLPLRLDVMRSLGVIAERLGMLSEKDMDVLRMRVDSGLGYRQIASRLGCTPEAVRKRLMRARQRLMHNLEDPL